ncbi:prolipoprotein diacylglyceryl transferase [uncultured Sanguibacteroides sp.]|uniref:prolipoprotein diacylglyceryl transferase n=1 Tax=uncultured Sanguibacteroides sp. TaxID=1635151 RepID=UPI0025E7750D|nr:prolipoprotein diacylglyceryl transferase [uncultured Sanguibacteroides sp.]
MLNYVNWDIDPVWFSIGGVQIRYYGLLFAAGVFVGAKLVNDMYRIEHRSDQQFGRLFMYVFVGIVLGARLGHCLFYDFDYFSSHIAEIFLPFKIDDGRFEYTGYQGLASHGGALGILIALAIYCYRYKYNYLGELDKIAIVTPLVGAFIRLANFMNSEIIGKVTDLPFAFIFKRVDMLPRHPAQLYEAFAYLLIFALLWMTYKRDRGQVSNGFFFGLSIALIFTARFLIEFVKINQESFEEHMLLNMGQLLSIPFILSGVVLFMLKRKKQVT